MNGIQLIKDNKFKLVTTLLIYLTYFCVGSITTLLGSCLLDLQILADTDFAKISLLIPIRASGHLAGSLIAGIVDQRLNPSLQLSLSNLISGVFIGIAPLFTRFEYIACSLFIAGVAHGLADVVTNTLLAITWKEKCTNFIQALHLFWGTGALIIPVIARPFLLPENEEDSLNQLDTNSSSADPMVTPIYNADDVMVHYAFFILSFISLIISVPLLAVYFKEKNPTQPDSNDQSTNKNKVEPVDGNNVKTYITVILAILIAHAIVGIEGVIGSLGASFSVKSDLHMEKRRGVLLATAFWICFSFYRLIYIVFTFVVSETKLLTASLLISLAGIFIAVPWGNENEFCIWIGLTFIGIGISPLFAATYGRVNKHTKITARITSAIFIAGIFGESIHPAICAAFMAGHTIVFLYYLAALGLSFVILFTILLVYCKLVFKGIQLSTEEHIRYGHRASIVSTAF